MTIAMGRAQAERGWFDALGTVFPEAAAYDDVASGVLAVALSRVKPYYVLWFRPQTRQTIRWGGDPTHGSPSTAGKERFSPK